MATAGQRDARLVVEAEVTGQEAINRLAANVRGLAKAGGDAAPEFERLATELEQLGAQSGALASLRAITAQLEELRGGQAAAAAAADQARREYDAQAASAQRLQAALQAARVAQQQGADAIAASTAELRTYKAEQAAAQQRDEDYSAQIAQRNLTLARLRETQLGLNAATREAAAALAPVAAEETKLAQALQRANAESAKATDAVTQRVRALQQAEAGALELGAAVADLGAEETRVADAVQKARLATEGLVRARGKAAEASKQQALIDRELADLDAQAVQVQQRLVEQLQRAGPATDELTQAHQRKNSATAAAVIATRALSAAEADAVAANAKFAASQAEVTAKIQQYIEASKRATDEAFNQAGIRSTAAIEREIRAVNEALSLLQREALAGRLSMADFERAVSSAAVRVQTLNREIRSVASIPGTFERLSDGINGLISRFGALGAAIATASVAVKPFIDAAVQLEQTRRILTTVTGSAATAATQINFVADAAGRAGAKFGELAPAYAKFAASALQTGVSLQTVNGVFESVALAAGNLGLSSDQTKRALEALSQIASKGVANMEELRQQLGDAIPGVLPLLAKDLGLTTQQFNKLVESGGLLAADALPAVGRAMQKLGPQVGGSVDGMVASWNRFVNVIKDGGAQIVEGPVGTVLGATFKFLAVALGDLVRVAVLASNGLSALGQTVVAFAAFAAQGKLGTEAFRAELEKIRTATGEANDRFNLQLAALKGVELGSSDAAKAVGTLGTGFAALNVQQAKTIEDAELQSSVTRKYAEAATAAYEATVKSNAGLLEGEQALARNVEAAQRYLAAIERANDAAVREADVLRAARAALIEKAGADEQALQNIRTGVEALDTKIAKADADIAKTQQQVERARELAAAAHEVAAQYGDQSKKVGELRLAVDGAQRAYDAQFRALQRGRGDVDALRKAEDDLAATKRALTKATDDLTKSIDLQTRTLDAQLKTQAKGLELEIAQSRTREAEAQRLGQETVVQRERLRQMELEQSIRRATSAVTLTQLELRLKEFDAVERSARASKTLTPELEAELRIKRLNTQAEILDVEAKREGNKEKDRQIERVKIGAEALGVNTSATERAASTTREHSKALGESADAFGKQAEALYGVGRAADSTATIMRQLKAEADAIVRNIPGVSAAFKELMSTQIQLDRLTGGGGGVIENNLFRGPNAVGEARSVLNDPRPTFTAAGQINLPPGYELDVEKLRQAGNPVINPGTVSQWIRPIGTGGSSGLNAVGSNADLLNAFFAWQNSDPTTRGPAPTPAPAPAPTRTVTVNLNVGGRTFPVTAPETTVDALLEELERAQRSAGG